MSDKTYIENSRGHETASKLKAFKICPKLYQIIYVDEKAPVTDQSDDAFKAGTALHHILEHGLDKFLEDYWISDSFLKDDIKGLILDRFKQKYIADGMDEMDITFEIEANKKRLNNAKVLLPDLRLEWYGTDDWTKIQGKKILTAGEGNVVVDMYKSLCSQPIMDVNGKYTKEQTITATYEPASGSGILSIGTKPDRLCIIQRGEDNTETERWTYDEYMEIVADMSLIEKRDYAKKHNIRGVLRDWKSTMSINKMKKELIYDRETSYGYIFSMSTYHTILFINTGVLFDAYLDLVEKTAPYITDVLALPQSYLHEKMINDVIPTMDKLIECKKSGEYAEPTREQILESREMSKYYNYFDSHIQDCPTYFNDLVTDLSY